MREIHFDMLLQMSASEKSTLWEKHTSIHYRKNGSGTAVYSNVRLTLHEALGQTQAQEMCESHYDETNCTLVTLRYTPELLQNEHTKNYCLIFLLLPKTQKKKKSTVTFLFLYFLIQWRQCELYYYTCSQNLSMNILYISTWEEDYLKFKISEKTVFIVFTDL